MFLSRLHVEKQCAETENGERRYAVMISKDTDKEFSEKEAARRRDDALRRALSMPPKPHKPIGKKEASPARPKKLSEDKSNEH